MSCGMRDPPLISKTPLSLKKYQGFVGYHTGTKVKGQPFYHSLIIQLCEDSTSSWLLQLWVDISLSKYLNVELGNGFNTTLEV